MRSCVHRLVGFSLLTALCAAPASAQLKPKLSKLNPLAKKEAGTASRAPTFNDRVLEITDGRVDQLLKGYAAEASALKASERQLAAARATYEAENRQHPARLKAYEQEHERWQSCQERVVKPAEAKAKADLQKAQDDVTGGDEKAFERKMTEIQTRIQAAQAAGNMDEVMRLADSLQRAIGTSSGVAANQASAEMEEAGRTCGAEPERPQPPTPPSANQANLDESGASAAGLTTEQYAILKERTQAAIDEDGTVRANASSYGFSATELAVLKQRAGELHAGYTPMRDGGL
jgi:hypothetical protein